MKNRKIFVLLFFITTWAEANQAPWITSPKGVESKKTGVEQNEKLSIIESVIHNEIEKAFAEPYRFIRTGRLERLLTLLNNNKDSDIQVIPQDSLRDEIINSTTFRRNYFDRCILNTIRYAQTRKTNKEAAKKSLFNAALIAFNNLDKPKLALAMYEIAEASGYGDAAYQVKKVQHYIKHDLPYTALLKVSWSSKSKKEKQEYADRLEDILRKNPESLLRLKFSRKIGDIYYSMEKYGMMMKWYQKAAAIDSNIVTDTPIGYRMNIGKKVMLRQKLISIIYTIYAIIIILFLLSIFRSKGFQSVLFLRRIFIGLPVFFGIAAITFFLDCAITSGTIEGILAASDMTVTKPIIFFSVFDTSFMKSLIIILIVGFLPILISILLTSFKKQISRILVIAILALTVISTWSHFILFKVFDKQLNKLSATSNSHIYFDGELEKLLVDNPKKVLKAQPALFFSGNEDLNQFIKEKKPELLKGNE